MVSKYNSEGYKDPVVYEALASVEAEERAARAATAYRPLVYICSPYAGDIERNTYRARAFSVGSVELEHAVSPAVPADGVLHRLIFLHGRLRKLLAEKERIQYILTVGGIDQFLYCLLIQGFCFHAVVRKPLLHLLYAVRVFKVGDLLHA